MQNSNKKIESHTSHRTLHTSQKGITLIALIITIIVMLILVGVTINVALNGGLFTKADEATRLTQIEAEKEELLSAVVAAIGNDGKVDFNYLDNNLPAEWDGRNGTYTSPKRNTYTVDPNGKITKGDNGETELDLEAIKQDIIANPESYLAKAQALGQSEELTDIGIGTDGEVVNLDLWDYYLDESEIYIEGEGSHGSTGYKGTFSNNGEIEGTIPQYIYTEGEIYPVVIMEDVFYNLTELKVAPKLPETVTELYQVFYGCTGLTVAPEIPKNVISMRSCFEKCSNLAGTVIINSDIIGSDYYDTYCALNRSRKCRKTNSIKRNRKQFRNIRENKRNRKFRIYNNRAIICKGKVQIL